MSQAKICVLGAGGSIGSQLVSYLLSEGYQVTAVVRRLSSAIRIGRFELDIINSDVLTSSVEELARIFENHIAVIDCTYSANPDYDIRIEESKRLARAICHAAKKANVERLVHLGTISVYPVKINEVSEQTPCAPSGDAYADSKLAAEQVLLENSANLASITVLQLPVVYGPFMMWTTSPVQQMLESTYTIADDLAGWCSPIHVDDVAFAVGLALKMRELEVQKILLGGGESIRWANYYQAFSELSDELKLNVIPRGQLEEMTRDERQQGPWHQLKSKFSDDGDFRQLVLAQFGIRTLYRWLKARRGQAGMDEIKARIANHTNKPKPGESNVLLIDSKTIANYDTMPAIKSNKAFEKLGFKPKINFKDGVQQTGEWLRWARILK